jgi:hypothetical protein
MEAETDDRDLYSGIDPGVTPQRVINGAAKSLDGFDKEPSPGIRLVRTPKDPETYALFNEKSDGVMRGAGF